MRTPTLVRRVYGNGSERFDNIASSHCRRFRGTSRSSPMQHIGALRFGTENLHYAIHKSASIKFAAWYPHQADARRRRLSTSAASVRGAEIFDADYRQLGSNQEYTQPAAVSHIHPINQRERLEELAAQGKVLTIAEASALIDSCTRWRLDDVMQILASSPAIPSDIKLFEHMLEAYAFAGYASLCYDIVTDIMPSRGLSSDLSHYRVSIIAARDEPKYAMPLLERVLHSGWLNADSFPSDSGKQTLCSFMANLITSRAWYPVSLLLLQLLSARDPLTASAAGPFSEYTVRIPTTLVAYPELFEAVVVALGNVIRNRRRMRSFHQICTFASQLQRLSRDVQMPLTPRTLSELRALTARNSSSYRRPGPPAMPPRPRESSAGSASVSISAEQRAAPMYAGRSRAVDASLLQALTELRKESIHGNRPCVRKSLQYISGELQARGRLEQPLLEELFSLERIPGGRLGGMVVETILTWIEGKVQMSEGSTAWTIAQIAAAAAAADSAPNGKYESSVNDSLGKEGQMHRLLVSLRHHVSLTRACNSALAMLSVQGDLMAGQRVLHVMRALNVPRTSDTFAYLFEMCAANRQPGIAMTLLREMSEVDGVVPGSSVYEVVIPLVAEKRSLEETMAVSEPIWQSQSPVPSSVCVALLGACARHQDALSALKVISMVRARGQIPDHVSDVDPSGHMEYFERHLLIGWLTATIPLTIQFQIQYSQVIDICANAGKWKAVTTLLTLMEADSVAPTSYTYTSAIKGCGRALEWQVAMRLFEEMKERKIQPHPSTFVVLLDAYAKAGKAKEALACLEELTHHGIRPDHRHYTAVLDALGRAGDFRGALACFEKYQREVGGPACHTTLSAVLSACAKGGLWETACRMWYLFPEDINTLFAHAAYVPCLLCMDAAAKHEQWPVVLYFADLSQCLRDGIVTKPILNSVLGGGMPDGQLGDRWSCQWYEWAHQSGGIVHWSNAAWGELDLHAHSRPMARVALRYVIAQMVDLHAHRAGLKGEGGASPGRNLMTGYVHDMHRPLQIVTGHGRYRAAGKSLLQEAVKEALSAFDPPLKVGPRSFNEGSLRVMPETLTAHVEAQLSRLARARTEASGSA